MTVFGVADGLGVRGNCSELRRIFFGVTTGVFFGGRRIFRGDGEGRRDSGRAARRFRQRQPQAGQKSPGRGSGKGLAIRHSGDVLLGGAPGAGSLLLNTKASQEAVCSRRPPNQRKWQFLSIFMFNRASEPPPLPEPPCIHRLAPLFRYPPNFQVRATPNRR